MPQWQQRPALDAGVTGPAQTQQLPQWQQRPALDAGVTGPAHTFASNKGLARAWPHSTAAKAKSQGDRAGRAGRLDHSRHARYNNAQAYAAAPYYPP